MKKKLTIDSFNAISSIKSKFLQPYIFYIESELLIKKTEKNGKSNQAFSSSSLNNLNIKNVLHLPYKKLEWFIV